MTTTSITSHSSGVTQRRDPGRSRVLRAAARAEWTKMRSVRSTIWTLLIAIALAIGFGALVGVTQINSWNTLPPPSEHASTPRRSASADCSSLSSPSVCSASC